MPASLAAMRAGVHRHADVGLGQGRGVVGAVAAHGHELALGLLVADQLQLGLGRGLRQEVVHAGLRRDGRRGQRIVAGDHHRADAHAPKLRKALADAALHDVLQMNDAEQLAIPGHGQRRAAILAIFSARRSRSRGAGMLRGCR